MNRIIDILLFFLFFFSAYPMDVPYPELNVWPESPQARALRQVMMPTPAMATGACEFSVPLYTIDVEGFQIPISLQYRTNGIRPEDDPMPIGYGWVLTPPMRISRQIIGRPDECFTFVGDQGSHFIDERSDADYEKGFRCLTMWNCAYKRKYLDFYDTEHDIYTIHLIDKTLTMIYKDGQMQGVGCDEYRVECGDLFAWFRVTDPQGVVYEFAKEGEIIDLVSLRTEWLLTSVTLLSGTEIKINWKYNTHLNHGLYIGGPRTIYHNAIKMPYEHNLGTESRNPKSHQYLNTHDLASIEFPGGRLECSYDNEYNAMAKGITVSNTEKLTYTASFSHSDDRRLLTEVNIHGDGTYSFEYNPTRFDENNGMDWWGYYNGRKNDILVPSIDKIEDNQRLNYPGADRNVDREKIKANILTKVTYPTGGSVEWDYEVHRFEKQTYTGNESLWLKNEISLSEGGGVRVKTITMKENPDDRSPRIKRYTYGKNDDGLARIEAVPYLHTFLSECPFLFARYYGGIAARVTDLCLVVNRFSDFMTGQTGCTPIWYDKVTESDTEGKTEYEFDNLCPSNISEREFWRVWPVEVNTAFSKGPVQTAVTRYKEISSGYRAVEKTEMSYRMIYNDRIKALKSFTVHRNMMFLYPTEYTPDFGVEQSLQVEPMDWQEGDFQSYEWLFSFGRKECNDWFDGYDYTLNPQTEQLTAKSVTTYFDNGHTKVTETYEYVQGTDLVSAMTVSDSMSSVRTEYSYSDSFSPVIATKMKTANVTGVAAGVTETMGSATRSYSLQMSEYGKTFRPAHVWQSRGGYTWSNATYSYDTKGFLISMTSVSGVRTLWTRDVYGHPLQQTVGNGITGLAGWENLVGLKSLTTPSGARQEFHYDGYGRLSEISLNSRKQTRYEYRIGQDGDNYIRTVRYTDNGVTTDSYERFDGLGRKWASMTQTDAGRYAARLTEFDRMGRVSQQWSLTEVDSHSASKTSIRNSATSYYSDLHPYSSLKYESSQRELPLSSTKSGDAWHTKAKSVQTQRMTNDASVFRCTRYTVTSDGVKSMGNYPPGLLNVERTIDEEGIITDVFKDFRGLTICRKQGQLATEYVYDDFGDLRYVLPPAVSGTHRRTDTEMLEFAYWYDYDSRGRLISKKLPGLREWKYIYDSADRLTAEQTPHHPSSKWRLYAYDHAGRQALAADCPVTEAKAVAFGSECRTATRVKGGTKGYSVPGLPPVTTVVSANYYDNHSFIGDNNLGAEFEWSDLSVETDAYNEHSASASGLLTGIYTGQGFESYHYNKDGLLIRRCATGFNRGVTETVYDYSCNVVRQISDSRMDMEKPDFSFTFAYDRLGRPVRTDVEHWTPVTQSSVTPGTGIKTSSQTEDVTEIAQTDGNPDHPDTGSQSQSESTTETKRYKGTASVSTSYNAIGQVATVAYGTNCTASLSYDTHGWLKSSSIRTPKTTMSETLHFADSSTPVYNGNLSAHSVDGLTYSYAYDMNNRLTSATFSSASASVDFSTQYSYDVMSNVSSVTRRGIVDKARLAERYGLLDEISITRDGNRISSVTAVTEGVDFEGMTGLAQNQRDMNISYDFAGRVCADQTRGITLIEYDSDGHPVRTVFETGDEQHDVWDGQGNHLSTEYLSPNSSGTLMRTLLREYDGQGRILDNGMLKMARFPGGYFDGTKPLYYITDYQGNNIAVVDESGSIKEKYGYYPYGEPWREATEQPFLYSDNERLLMDGLHEYDFHDRRYNPCVPGFSSWDKMQEKYPWLSPYCYCAGNPVNFIDPNGMYIAGDCLNEWDRMRADIQNRLNSLTDEINEIRAKGAAKKWSEEKIEERIGDRELRVASLNKTLATMTDLESSEHGYSLSLAKDVGEIKMGADGVVLINYFEEDTSNFVHEVTHCGQYENGNLDFGVSGFPKYQDLYDEAAAYFAQYAYEPFAQYRNGIFPVLKSIREINAQWVDKITLNGKRPYSSGGKFGTGRIPIGRNSDKFTRRTAYPSINNQK